MGKPERMGDHPGKKEDPGNLVISTFLRKPIGPQGPAQRGNLTSWLFKPLFKSGKTELKGWF